MTDILNLNSHRANKENDNTLWTPADMLAEALGDIKEGREAYDRAVVLTWADDGEAGFDVGYYAANMKSSEIIALLEMIKSRLLRDMGLT